MTKAQLVAFYSKHDPSKVASVDKILKHYTTAQLVTQLKERYGAAPTPGERPRSKGDMLAAKRRQELADFYRKHDPEKVAKADELLANYPFENIVSSLKIKFKSCPPVRTTQLRMPLSIVAAVAGADPTRGTSRHRHHALHVSLKPHTLDPLSFFSLCPPL